MTTLPNRCKSSLVTPLSAPPAWQPPAFAAAATGIDMTRPITVEGDLFSLARLEIAAGSHMVGQTVETLEQSYNVSVVLLRRDGQSDLHPSSSRQVAAGDLVAVLGGSTEISRLAQENR